MSTSTDTTEPESTLAAFVAGIEYGDLPGEVVETVERAVLDTVGVLLAGSTEPIGQATATLAGGPVDDPLGLPGSPPSVALALGAAGHALDYDDLSWAMDGHPSVALVPPLLALADRTNASGRDAVTAYVAGFETACSVAAPISPDHYERGWHATATFGTFGAAATAARLIELDEEPTRQALGMAASMPAGLKRNFGSTTKPLHAGLAARSGVTAALLAEAGMTADSRAVSGERGFWDLYAADGDATGTDDVESDDLWLQREGINVKAYPCCYFTHTAIAATQSLAESAAVDPADVTSVEVTASPGAGDALQYADPETGSEAKFSMEYAVAAALTRERVGLDAFTAAALADPTVQRIRDRVFFEVDSDLPYDSHAATVTVETTDGRTTEHLTDPPGTFDNPLPDDRLREKFLTCAGRRIDAEDAAELADALADLRTEPSLASLLGGTSD